MKSVRIFPTGRLKGVVRVPGDKSISHRAVMFSALSEGSSVIKGLLLGEDVRATLRCFQAMGVKIEIEEDQVVVHGVGLQGLKPPSEVLDCGNSGTTLRLLLGILAAQPFTSRLTGDASLNRRPMERVIRPLSQMGATIEEWRSSPEERVLKVTGRPLRGIDYRLPMASAQVKSAILLAGLYAQGSTRILESVPSRNHTEIMLKHKGALLTQDGETLTLQPCATLKATDLTIPGDISSAAFFLVGGCLGNESSIHLKEVGINPTRTGILEVLEKMGADITLLSPREEAGEAIADLHVISSDLKAGSIRGSIIPRLIDEIPVLSLAAGAAHGQTQVADATELRVKETDRIAAVAEEMGRLGLPIQTQADGFLIEGPHVFRGGEFHSHGDHRMAMSLAIALTFANSPGIIRDVDCVTTSYPSFFTDLESLGGAWELL